MPPKYIAGRQDQLRRAAWTARVGDLEQSKDVVISGPWARLGGICYHTILSVFISLGVRHSWIAKSAAVYSPARIMSNHVTPGRELRPISAKDVHCLGSRNFGWTTPSQICLIFALAVQVHDR
jgi:hypothetical protein